MVRKNFLTSLFAIVIVAVAAIVSVAQTAAPVGGQVLLKEGDKTTPVVGALVEVFRVDIKAKFPADKTDKKGYFKFAGLPFGAVFALSVSGPGIAPQIVPNITAGKEDIVINVSPGDGKVLPEDEVRRQLAAGATTRPTEGESDADRKKREEFEKQKAEVENRNKKINETNQIIDKSIQNGTQALTDKNYDLAVQSFRDGFNADPTFVGTAPYFLNSLAIALIQRGTDKFNKTVTLDADARAAGREAAKVDFEEAITSCEKSLVLLKDATSPDPNTQKNYDANKLKAIEVRKNAFRVLAQTGANRERGKEAAVAFAEYLATETDPARKIKGQMDLAMTLQDSNEFEAAIVEFDKILVDDPNNVDALVGRGLSLVNVGYINMDADPVKGKAQLQDAANTLQKFVELAPDTHKLKQSALESIAQLKDIVTPQKTKTTTTKKKN